MANAGKKKTKSPSTTNKQVAVGISVEGRFIQMVNWISRRVPQKDSRI